MSHREPALIKQGTYHSYWSEARVCRQCQGYFYAARSTAQYCSDNCRVKANRAKKKGGRNESQGG